MKTIKEHENVLKQIVAVFDLLLITCMFFVGYQLRIKIASLSDEFTRMYPLEYYLNLLPIVLSLWGITLYSLGTYREFRTKSVIEIFMDIAKSFFVSWLLFGALAFLMKFHYLSRSFIFVVFFSTAAILFIERVTVLQIVRIATKHGMNRRKILIIGTGKRAQSFIRMLENHPEWGYEISGLIDDEATLQNKPVAGYTVIGTIADIPRLLNENVIDDVVIIVPRSWLGKLEHTILYCEQIGKRVSVAVDLFNVKFAKAHLRNLNYFPLMTFETTPDTLWPLFLKRALDIILSAVTLILLSPVLAVIAVLITLSSKGPCIFKQKRVGLNGRAITVYKFRTMVMDAEDKLNDLQKFNEASGLAFKMKDDPRLIKYGKFLRKFSLDELPQFLNVLKGDMSIIGPRPLPAEVKDYDAWQIRRLSMRPGITCIWQIECRERKLHFDEWMNLDLDYIDTWSLWLDLKIFLKTIPIVLFGISPK